MTESDWSLHPQLLADTALIGDLPLSRVLLSSDARYPWTLLVPRRAGIREIHELADPDQLLLLQESVLLSRALAALFTPTKLNVAALGNVVPQLHVHHIVRYDHDPAWPAPVWGRLPALAYTPAAMVERIAQLREVLGSDLVVPD